jgi:hypothetical protein
MKKMYLVIVAFCCISAASFAQIERGIWLVGASSNLGISSQSIPHSPGYTILTVNLRGGYFVVNNLVVGLNTRFTKLDDSSTLALGVFGRYYIGGKFFLGGGITSIKPNSGNSTIEIPLEVGYAAFVTNNIAIEPSVNFSKGDGYDLFGANIGFSIYFGR